MRVSILIALGLSSIALMPAISAGETASAHDLITYDEAIAHVKNAQFDLAHKECLSWREQACQEPMSCWAPWPSYCLMRGGQAMEWTSLFYVLFSQNSKLPHSA
jgi:hypothetical protein